MTLNELNQFFDTYEQIEYRIKEIAPFCTNITSREEVTGFSCYDGKNVCIHVWSQDCGNDAYEFPLEYLSMETSKIKECEKKKAEEARKRAEREAREEKKRRERQERLEYERLKKKYEGGEK